MSVERATGRTETVVVSVMALLAVCLVAAGLLRRRPAVPALEGPARAGDLAPRRIDVNSATAEELQLIPGIGPVLSRRIVEYRERHGGFRSVQELERVYRVSSRLVESIEPYVAIGRAEDDAGPRGKKIPGAIER